MASSRRRTAPVRSLCRRVGVLSASRREEVEWLSFDERRSFDACWSRDERRSFDGRRSCDEPRSRERERRVLVAVLRCTRDCDGGGGEAVALTPILIYTPSYIHMGE